MGGRVSKRISTASPETAVGPLSDAARQAAYLEGSDPAITDESLCVAVGWSAKSRSQLWHYRQRPEYQRIRMRAFLDTVGRVAGKALRKQEGRLDEMDAQEVTDLLRALLQALSKVVPAEVALDGHIDVCASGSLRVDLATATQADMLRELARLAREDPAVRAVLAAEDSAE